MKSSSSLATHRLALVACLGALSFVLMLFEFPIIPVAPYLKVDFSDVIVLIATLIDGPITGVAAAVMKAVLHALVNGLSVGTLLGSFSDLLAAVALLLPFSWLVKQGRSAKRFWVAAVAGTLLMTIVMALANWWVLTPLYMKLWSWKPTLPIVQLLVTGVVPFNLVKGLLVAIVTAFIYFHLPARVINRLK